MDLRIVFILSVVSIQALWAAPPVDLPDNLEDMPTINPNDAQVLSELENLREQGEKFQLQALDFLENLPNRLSERFSQSHQLFILLAQQFANAIRSQISPLISNLNLGRQIMVDQASRFTNEGLRQGQNGLRNGLSYAQSSLNGLSSSGNSYLQSGINYLTPSEVSLEARSLGDEIPLDEFAEAVECEKKEKSQNLHKRDDSSVTGAISTGIGEIGTSTNDAFKNMASFTTGGIRSIFDALSGALSTTQKIGSAAREQMKKIQTSGEDTAKKAIGTAGSYVSGALDKTGSVVDTMKVGS